MEVPFELTGFLSVLWAIFFLLQDLFVLGRPLLVQGCGGRGGGGGVGGGSCVGGGSRDRYVVNIVIAFVIASCHAGGGFMSSLPMFCGLGVLCSIWRREDPAFREADDSDSDDMGEDELECSLGGWGDAGTGGLSRGSLLLEACRTWA